MRLTLIAVYCFVATPARAAGAPLFLEDPAILAMQGSVYGVNTALTKWANSETRDYEAATTCLMEISGGIKTFFMAYRAATTNSSFSEARDKSVQRLAALAVADMKLLFANRAGEVASVFSLATMASFSSPRGMEIRAAISQINEELVAQ